MLDKNFFSKLNLRRISEKRDTIDFPVISLTPEDIFKHLTAWKFRSNQYHVEDYSEFSKTA